MKETLQTMVCRIDERLSNLISTNDEKHKEILASIDKLAMHVNDENTKMNTRMENLENKSIELKAYWKLIVLIIGGSASGAIGIPELIKLLGGA